MELLFFPLGPGPHSPTAYDLPVRTKSQLLMKIERKDYRL